MLKFIKYLSLFALLAILIIILSLSRHGLPEGLTRRVERSLQFPGVIVTMSDIKLRVFEGIIANDLRCYLQGDLGDPFLSAERIVLKPCLLYRRKVAFGLRRIIIKNAKAILPPGGLPEETPPVILENLQAEIIFDTSRELRVEEFAAVIAGIKTTGRGRITLPEQSLERTNLSDAGSAARQWLQYYQRLQFRHPPNLTVEFDLHSSWTDDNRLQCRLTAREVAYNGHYAEGLIGDIRLNGNTLSADLRAAQVRLDDVALQSCSAKLEVNDQAIHVQNLEAFAGNGVQRGPINLNAIYNHRDHTFTGHVRTGCTPDVILPALKSVGMTNVIEKITNFNFNHTPPRGDADFNGYFSGSLTNSPWITMKGTIHADRLAYRGVPLNTVQSDFTAKFSAEQSDMTLTRLTIVRDEGIMQGTLKLDLNADQITFDGLSSAAPKAAAQMIHPVIAEILDPFHFSGPTHARAAGRIDLSGIERDAVELSMECWRAGWKVLTPDYCTLSLNLTQEDVEFSEITGEIFGGNFSGMLSLTPGCTQNAPYLFAGFVHASAIDFNRIMYERLGASATPYQGRLSLQLSAVGPLDTNKLGQIVGQGRLRITDGRIFQLPIFGGLTELLGKIIPGLNMVLRQTDADARFIIRDGRIRAKEVLIDGDVFSLRAEGDCHFDGRLDFKVQINLLRRTALLGPLLRFAIMPISKALEFELTGTLDNPRWRLAYIPNDLQSIFGRAKNH